MMNVSTGQHGMLQNQALKKTPEFLGVIYFQNAQEFRMKYVCINICIYNFSSTSPTLPGLLFSTKGITKNLP